MRQQINLYQPIFSQERKQLSAVTVVGAIGVIMAMLLGISVYADRRVDQLERDVQAMRARATQQEQVIAKAGEVFAARGNPAEIDARVKQLTESVAARRRALKVLQAGAAGQTTGFASRLEALARRHVDGLWLDGLVLSGTTGSMTLRGATLNAGTVPIYLQGLARETALSGTRFDDFVIERRGLDVPKELSQDAEEGSDTTKPRVATPVNHIRFRAGSKSLSVSAPETAT
jgi:hypothetical protein